MGSAVILYFPPPIGGLLFPLLAPHLSPHSFSRKIYKGRVGNFTVYQFIASVVVAIVVIFAPLYSPA
jgi:hypothetical protein